MVVCDLDVSIVIQLRSLLVLQLIEQPIGSCFELKGIAWIDLDGLGSNNCPIVIVYPFKPCIAAPAANHVCVSYDSSHGQQPDQSM